MTHGPVVVGVDGSSPSERALTWARDYARLSGSALRVICAWEVPPLGGAVSYGDPDILRQAALEIVATATAEPGPNDVPVEGHAIEGHPSNVLVHESQQAQLLVLGARGRGGFADMLLGSVSAYCSHHAKCPVVIVREDRPQ
jgi:nucleotide-binding universal stress UspA family protein